MDFFMRIDYNFLNEDELNPFWENHAISYLEEEACAFTIDYRAGLASCAENSNIVYHFIEYIIRTSVGFDSNKEDTVIIEAKDFFDKNLGTHHTSFKIGSVHATILNTRFITFEFDADAHLKQVFELFFLNDKNFISFPSDQDRKQCELCFKKDFTTESEKHEKTLLLKFINDTLEGYCDDSKKRKWFASNPERHTIVTSIKKDIHNIFITRSRLDKQAIKEIASLMIERRDTVQESHTSGKLGRKKPTKSRLVKKLNEILFYLRDKELLSKQELKTIAAEVRNQPAAVTDVHSP